MGSLLALAALLLASGPKPEKKDVLYLVHADNLIQTEVVKPAATEGADGTTYSFPGDSSLARTPLALPVFLLDADQIKPQQLRLIRLTPKGGHREAIVPKKGAATDDPPILLTVSGLGGGLYKFEVVNEIENGEYALTAGTGQFFCFTVF